MEARVRYAPSPTGPQHIGGARSALFNYLLARKTGGTFVLRSEDTDLERSSKESEQHIIEALQWLNIKWDEGLEVGGPYGPYRQTERLDIYGRYTRELLDKGLAYYCYCSEEELEQERQELIAQGETPRYRGKCRHLTEKQKAAYEAEGRKPVVRFRVPEGQDIVIHDAVRGRVVFESDGIGDFVIVKSDGIPTYNFAVVIDDTLMKITHVIRGEEHLSNTPRQVLLYQALGIQPPEFAHVSLILNGEGKKMSKRDGDTNVVDYKKKGYLPEAVVNFIALLGWSPAGEQEFFTLEELCREFSLERVSKSPAVFDINKLNHINAHYMKEAAPERLAALALPFLQEMDVLPAELSADQEAWLNRFVAAVVDHLSYMEEIKEFVPYVCGVEVPEPGEEAREFMRDERIPAVLDLFRQKIGQAGVLDIDTVKAMMKQIGKELKVGGKLVFMPVRIVLTGQMHGPELDHLIPLMGKDVVLTRLARSLKNLGIAN